MKFVDEYRDPAKANILLKEIQQLVEHIEIVAAPSGIVVLNTGFGGGRIVDLLVGEQLPRIC